MAAMWVKHAGFPKIVLITDRGYESLRNLEKYILDGQALIMWIRVRQSMVLGRIREFGNFSHVPEGMEIDEESRLYYKQYDLDYKVDVRKGCTKSSDRLKLNLYFDPVKRSEQLMQLDIDIKRQQDTLTKLTHIAAGGASFVKDPQQKDTFWFGEALFYPIFWIKNFKIKCSSFQPSILLHPSVWPVEKLCGPLPHYVYIQGKEIP